jgi:hypothetical protein
MLTKGKHIFVDFIGINGNEKELGEFVFNLMIDSVETNTSMKIVHKYLCILNGDIKENKEDTQANFIKYLVEDAPLDF